MASERIIFLDIDGVLNHVGTAEKVNGVGEPAEHGFTGLSPECVLILDGLVARTGAQIVVSSTWRMFLSLGQIGRALRRHGFTHPRAIIDITPTCGPTRGDEIQVWLNDNARMYGGPFVILDDDDDMAHLRHRWVRTNPYEGGLTAESAEQAAKMLEAQ